MLPSLVWVKTGLSNISAFILKAIINFKFRLLNAKGFPVFTQLAAHDCCWFLWYGILDYKITQLSPQRPMTLLTERKRALLSEKLLKQGWNV